MSNRHDTAEIRCLSDAQIDAVSGGGTKSDIDRGYRGCFPVGGVNPEDWSKWVRLPNPYLGGGR